MRKKWIMILMMFALLLAGCGTGETSDRSASNGDGTNNNKEEEIVKAEAAEGDFVYRLVSEKAVYEDSEEVKLYAELEYVGDQPEIKIYHAASPFYFPIVEKTRNYTIDYPMNEPLLTTTLEKGQPFREEYKGGGAYSLDDDTNFVAFMEDFMEKGFPVGEYTVNGMADFYIETNENDTEEKEKYKMNAEVEFEVVE